MEPRSGDRTLETEGVRKLPPDSPLGSVSRARGFLRGQAWSELLSVAVGLATAWATVRLGRVLGPIQFDDAQVAHARLAAEDQQAGLDALVVLSELLLAN